MQRLQARAHPKRSYPRHRQQWPCQKEEVFWQVYERLELYEQQKPSNYSQSDKNTVSGMKLQESLLATGKFHNNEAAVILENMVKVGKLKQVMLDTFRKVNHEIV